MKVSKSKKTGLTPVFNNRKPVSQRKRN